MGSDFVIILRDVAYQALMKEVAQINRSDIGAEALVSKFADAGYAAAEMATQHVESDGRRVELRDGQSDRTDATNNSDGIAADAASFNSKGLTR